MKDKITFSRRKFWVVGTILILVVFFGGFIFAYQSWGFAVASVPPFKYLTQKSDLARIMQINDLIEKNYIEETDKEKIMEGAMVGMVESLEDPYSFYLNKTYYEEEIQEDSGKGVGIGVVFSVTENNEIVITEVYDNSSAHKVGLKALDIITAIDGTSVNGQSDLVNMVLGEEGKEVAITIRRDENLKTYKVPRENYVVSSVKYKEIDDYTYIKISGFEGECVKQFDEAVDFAERQKSAGLIIDLRWNPGGDVSIFEKVADRLVKKGNLIYFKERDGSKSYTKATSDEEYTKPIVVLVNNSSASASEALCGTLQDYGLAKVVGEKTFGKGVMQTIYPLVGGAALHLTTAYYYLPEGRCIHGDGIEPDVEVQLPEELARWKYKLNDQNDTQLQKAIETIKTMK